MYATLIPFSTTNPMDIAKAAKYKACSRPTFAWPTSNVRVHCLQKPSATLELRYAHKIIFTMRRTSDTILSITNYP